MSWKNLESAVTRVNKLLGLPPKKQFFNYKNSKKQLVPINYFEWGQSKNPTIICMGGVANSAMRFSFLAKALSKKYHIIAMDWAGRGDSGWLEDIDDYNNEQAIDQLNQLIKSIKKRKVHLIGSSLGGTIAISFSSRNPKKVKSLILNDIGPEMSASRRKKRSIVLAKHYVFKEFSDLERKVGASQKNDGITNKDLLLFNAFHLTKWSESDQGRIYKHDPRAMLAYKQYAKNNLNQWDDWRNIEQPTLLIRGVLSDALTNKTIKKMLSQKDFGIHQVPNAGHTPSLMTSDQITAIENFLSHQ